MQCRSGRFVAYRFKQAAVVSKILPVISYTKGTHNLLTVSKVLILIGSMSLIVIQCSICVLVNLQVSSQPYALADMGIAGELGRSSRQGTTLEGSLHARNL